MNEPAESRSSVNGGRGNRPARDARRKRAAAIGVREFPSFLLEDEATPSFVKRAASWCIVLLVCALLVWSYLFEIEVVSTALGRVVPDGRTKVVQPIETSMVRTIRVTEGQAVRDGEVLLELDPTVSKADLDASRQKRTLLLERVSDARALAEIGAISRHEYLQLQQDLAALQADLTKAQQRYDLQWLRSPVDGIVQTVHVTTVGSVVTPAQPLVTVVPIGTPLIVEAVLSNADVGFVRVGQRTEIKVDTFAFQKYGTLKGELVWVSPDAEDKNSQASQTPSEAGTATSSYKVHVKPEKLSFRVDGKDVPITVGMTVQADIITDNRRIIDFFLSPIIKYFDEGLAVR
jgi:hemolysin D